MDVRMDRVYVGTKAKVEGTRIDRRQWQREAGRDGSRGRRRREGPGRRRRYHLRDDDPEPSYCHAIRYQRPVGATNQPRT
uniref:Uncharacterized protein n=1 Tax=Oryza sativa subsp. japonica TaxID=39947 RepID=Q652F8_ORYSJ|nr:hypothetical protein [Oryza sativa Japonica Group]